MVMFSACFYILISFYFTFLIRLNQVFLTDIKISYSLRIHNKKKIIIDHKKTCQDLDRIYK